jgi:hypothetical protein
LKIPPQAFHVPGPEDDAAFFFLSAAAWRNIACGSSVLGVVALLLPSL